MSAIFVRPGGICGGGKQRLLGRDSGERLVSGIGLRGDGSQDSCKERASLERWVQVGRGRGIPEGGCCRSQGLQLPLILV